MAKISSSISPQTIGDRLRRVRQARGYSVRKLATEAGVGKNTVVEIEQGRKPHRSTLVAICTALGIKLNQLLSVEDATGERIARLQLCKGGERNDAERFLPGGTLAPKMVRVGPRTPTMTGTGETFIYVISGAVTLYVNGTPQQVLEGEAMSFWTSEPHSFEAADGLPDDFARVLIVNSTRPSTSESA